MEPAAVTSTASSSSTASTSPPSNVPVRHGAEWHRHYARKLVVSDTLVLLWVFTVAHIAWGVLDDSHGGAHAPFETQQILASAGLLVVWLAALTFAGTRETVVLGAGPDEYKRIVTATLMWFAVTAFAAFMINWAVPRSYVGITVVFGLALLLLSRWSWRQWLVYKRQRGLMSSRTLVVGTRDTVEYLTATVGQTSHFGYRLIGACVPHDGSTDPVGGVPIVGSLDDVAAVVERGGVDAVLVTSTDSLHPGMVRELGWKLEPYSVQMIVAPSLVDIAGPRVRVRPVAGLPLLHVEEPSYRGTSRWPKALFDRLGSLGLILIGSPILIAAAIAVKLTSDGPVFFLQERVGRNGQHFKMIKFRSMVTDAEDRLAELQADSGNEVMFKMRDDPRVTKVGKLLRRTSIDELPQLFNVLKGDMSLVGPRPPLVAEADDYGATARRRLLVRPGITGLWQISGRSNLDWEETVRLDLYYVENWSLVGDLLILWKTVRAVTSSEGAF